MDLVFHHNGQLRQGAELTQIPINDLYDREVMVDPDTNEVFLVSTDSIGTLFVKALTPDEWNALRIKYGLSMSRSPTRATNRLPIPRPVSRLPATSRFSVNEPVTNCT